jgi:hypothetical protein
MGKLNIKRTTNTMFLSANTVQEVDQADLGSWVVMVGLVKVLIRMERAGSGSLLTFSLSVSKSES